MAPFRNIVSRKTNLAILLVLFVLVLGLVCTLFALATAMDKAERLEVYKIIGICAVVLGQIALLIRAQSTSEYLHKSAHETRNVVGRSALMVKAATEEMAAKTNGGLTEAIKVACTEAKEGERQQLLEDDAFLQRAADRLCPMLAEDVAARVAELLRTAKEAERLANVQRPPYTGGAT